MPSTVDERVVQMRIDNAQFESGAKKTLDTLEQLKKKSDFKDVQNKVDSFNTDQMSSAIEKVKVSFDALEVVGKRVLENLTDSLYGFVSKTVKQLTVDPLSLGFKKFGDKTIAVATLAGQGYQLSVINEQLENLMRFSDETSYNFTDMVENITKFTASGQELEPSVRAMEGIALWAATAGQNATTASRAMYQLSQAMSKGALKYDDYKSIQNASMDTIQFRQKAADVAVELGYLTSEIDKQTGEVIYTTTELTQSADKMFTLSELFTSDALSRTMWFSSDVMMDTFTAYSDGMQQVLAYMDEHAADYEAATGKALLFKTAIEQIEEEAYQYAKENGVSMDEALAANGYNFDMFSLRAAKAGQETRTWGDTIEATLDAVSSGWMKTFELIFGTQKTATEFFSTLVEKFYDLFAAPAEGRNDILGDALNDNLTKLTDHLGEAGISAEDLEATINQLARDAGKDVDPMIERFGTLTEAIRQGELSVGFLRIAIEKLRGGQEAVDPEKTIQDIKDLSKNVNHLSAEERQALGAEYGLTERQLNIIDANMRNLKGAYGDEVVKKLITGWMEQAGTLDKLAESAEGAGEAVEGLDDEYINELIAGIHDKSGGELLRDSFLNIFDIILGPIEAIRNAFSEVFGEDLSANIRSAIEHFYALTERLKLSESAAKGLQKVFEAIFNALKPVIAVAKGIIGAIGGAIGAIADVIDRALSILGGDESLTAEFEQAEGFFGKLGVILKPVKEYIDRIQEALSGVWEKLQPIWDTLSNNPIVQSAIGILGSAVTGLGDAFNSLAEAVSGSEINFKSISDTFNKLGQIISFVFTSLFGNPEELKVKTEQAFDTISKTVSEKIKNIPWTKILDSIKVGLLAAIVMKISKLLDSLKQLTDSAKTWTESLKAPFTQLGNAIERMSKAASILIVAAAIAALAASIWLLCKVDPDRFFNVALTIGILMTILSRIAKNASGMFANNTFKGLQANIKVIPSLMGALIGVAAVILAAVYALKQLESLNPGKLVTSIIAIIVVLTAVVLALGLISKYANDIDKNAATAILGIAAMVAAIGFVMSQIKSADTGSVQAAMTGIVLSVLGIAAVLYVAKNLKASQIDALGTMFLKFGAAMLMLGVALAMTKNIPPESALTLAVIAGMMVVMVAIMAAISESLNTLKAGNVQKLATSMLILSVAILVIAPALALLSMFDPDKVIVAAAAIALVALSLGFVIKLLENTSVGQILAVGVAFTLMAVGVGLLIATIAGLIGIMVIAAVAIPWDTMSDKLDSFGVAMGKIGQAAKNLYPLGLLAMMVGAAVLFFGIGCITAAAGVGVFTLNIFLFAASIYLISAAIPMIATALTALVDLILNHAEEIMMVTMFVMGMIAIAMIAKKAEVANAAAQLVVSILNTISQLGPKLIPVVAGILGILFAAILNFISPITEFLVLAIINLLNGLSSAIRSNEAAIIGALNAVVGTLVELLMKVIAQQVPMVAKFLLLLLDRFVPGFGAAFKLVSGKTVDEVVESINESMKKNEGKIEDIIDEVFMDDNHKKNVKAEVEVDTEVKEGTTKETPTTTSSDRPATVRRGPAQKSTGTAKPAEPETAEAPVPVIDSAAVTDTASTTMTDMTAQMQQFIDSGEGGTLDLSSFLGGASTEGAAGEVLSSDTMSSFGDLTSIISQFSGGGADSANGFMDNFGETFSARMPDLKTQFGGMFNGLDATASDAGTGTGNTFADNTAKGMETKEPDVEAASTKIDAAMQRGTANAFGQGVAPGANFGSGVAVGISSRIQMVVNAATQMVAQAIAAANAEAQNHSPSKVMIQSGQWFGEGFAIGITEETSAVVEAAQNMVKEPIDLIADSLTQVVALTDKDFDLQPTITPVVDMTNVSAASDAVGALLSSEAMSMGVNQTVAHSIDGITSAAITNNRNYNSELQQLIAINTELLESSRAGGNVYLSDNVIAGMVNRRLGVL